MKITIKTLSEKALENNDYRDEYHLLVNGTLEIEANDYGEPEDNTLSRDLSFVYDILPLMKKAYEAGKNGVALEIEEIKLDEPS
jgi:hypothetical protein